MSGTDELTFKTVCHDGAVTFRLPEDWVGRREGMLGLFHPQSHPAGTLRVALREVPLGTDPSSAEAARTGRVVMHQTALLFVRPDDPRASGRAVNTLPNGDIYAYFTIHTNDTGERLRHHLWLRGTAFGNVARFALFSYILAEELDGSEPWTATVSMLDHEIRAADISHRS